MERWRELCPGLPALFALFQPLSLLRPAATPLTCGLPVSGLLQVAQRMRIVTQMVEGNASAVGGLEVALLLLQHLEAVLAHPLVIHQLRLQQAGCGGARTGALRACRQPQTSHPRGNPHPVARLSGPKGFFRPPGAAEPLTNQNGINLHCR